MVEPPGTQHPRLPRINPTSWNSIRWSKFYPSGSLDDEDMESLDTVEVNWSLNTVHSTASVPGKRTVKLSVKKWLKVH